MTRDSDPPSAQTHYHQSQFTLHDRIPAVHVPCTRQRSRACLRLLSNVRATRLGQTNIAHGGQGTACAVASEGSANAGLAREYVVGRCARVRGGKGAKRKSQSSAYACLSPVIALSLLLVSQEINPSIYSLSSL